MKKSITASTLSSKELSDFLFWLSQTRLHRSKERNDCRNLCMALLMCDAGLRVGEVVQLRQHDLVLCDVPVKQLEISSAISKSKSSRIVPLSQRIQQAINNVRNYNWIYSEMSLPLFAFYTNDCSKHITVRQVERVFDAAGHDSIGRSVRPHMLRHTFGSKMMRITNAAIVQELLGHKQLSSTQVYMHPNGDDLQSAIDNLNT